MVFSGNILGYVCNILCKSVIICSLTLCCLPFRHYIYLQIIIMVNYALIDFYATWQSWFMIYLFIQSICLCFILLFMKAYCHKNRYLLFYRFTNSFVFHNSVIFINLTYFIFNLFTYIYMWKIMCFLCACRLLSTHLLSIAAPDFSRSNFQGFHF